MRTEEEIKTKIAKFQKELEKIEKRIDYDLYERRKRLRREIKLLQWVLGGFSDAGKKMIK